MSNCHSASLDLRCDTTGKTSQTGKIVVMATQHIEGPHTIIENRPLQDWPLSDLVQEVEADYNTGQQVRFDVLSELIFRAKVSKLSSY